MLDLSPYIYGGLAAVCAEIVTFPVDTAKVRLQLQGQTKDRRWRQLKYSGTLHCLWSISKEEGIRSLYKGLSPAVLRQAVYGTIKFGLYYSAKEVVLTAISKDEGKAKNESTLINLACAIFAGSVSSAIATPTDVVKVKMQARATEVPGGLITVTKDIFMNEGVKGLWRGVHPTAQRAALVAGVQLPVYDWTKFKLCSGPSAIMKDGVACHLVSSMVAGVSAAFISSPVDVVRTRLMVQRRAEKLVTGKCSATYRSALHCGIHTLATEGVAALFKGFVPSFARMGPWNVIFFVVYEKCKTFGSPI